MKGKIKKLEKGITLIALVITIIILLIIAGVTISMLKGENGILKRSTNATEKYLLEKEREELSLALMDIQTQTMQETGRLATLIDVQEKIDKTKYGVEAFFEPLASTEDVAQKPTYLEITKLGTSYKFIVNDKLEIVKSENQSTGTIIDANEAAIIEAIKGEIEAVQAETGSNSISKSALEEILKKYAVENTGIVYNEDGTIKEIITKDGNYTISLSDIYTGEITEDGTHQAGTTYYNATLMLDKNNKKYYLPEGFSIHSDSTNDVNTGIVITDGTSEFVWIPIDDINSMVRKTIGFDNNGNTNYQGRLYNFSSTGYTEKTNYGQGLSSNKEPDAISNATNGDDTNNVYYLLRDDMGLDGTKDEVKEKWKKQLQEEYNSMVKSVATYKGFYVGRYETSLDGSGKAQSKKGETSATIEEDSANTWFGLYQKQKEYKVGKAQGTMMWGSQWNQVLIWMQNQEITISSSTPMEGKEQNVSRITGAEGSKDILNNIYDVYGNSRELTLEAKGTEGRVCYGGSHKSAIPPISTSYALVMNKNSSEMGSRLSIYIETVDEPVVDAKDQIVASIKHDIETLQKNTGSNSITKENLEKILRRYAVESTGIVYNGNGTIKEIVTKDGNYTIGLDKLYSGQIVDIATTEKTVLEYATAAKPTDSASIIESDSTKGIVMVDSKENEWVWIEVPGSVFTTATHSEDYDNISADLKKYVADYRMEKPNEDYYYTDDWFDSFGTKYSDDEEYSRIKFISSASGYTSAKSHYGNIYVFNSTSNQWVKTSSYVSGQTYYVKREMKNLVDKDGCGLTYEQYYIEYNKMLKSIYENRGFYISRYEAGIKGSEDDISLARSSNTSVTDSSPDAVSKKDTIPYTVVKVNEAMNLANRMKTGNKTYSVMFGIQWDLICKYLEVNSGWNTSTNSAIYYLKENSESWGNYYNSPSFKLDSTNIKGTTAVTWQQVTSTTRSRMLYSSAATSSTKKMNIYDFAGNAFEWTLELGKNGGTYRGGTYNSTSPNTYASHRAGDSNPQSYGTFCVTFRPTIY